MKCSWPPRPPQDRGPLANRGVAWTAFAAPCRSSWPDPLPDARNALMGRFPGPPNKKPSGHRLTQRASEVLTNANRTCLIVSPHLLSKNHKKESPAINSLQQEEDNPASKESQRGFPASLRIPTLLVRRPLPDSRTRSSSGSRSRDYRRAIGCMAGKKKAGPFSDPALWSFSIKTIGKDSEVLTGACYSPSPSFNPSQ